MPFKDILVHFDGGLRDPVRLDLAARLAVSHGAHLTGLYVADTSLPSWLEASALAYADATDADALVSRLEQGVREGAAQAEAQFNERRRQDGFQGEWRLVHGRLAATVALHARYADLTIIGQDDPQAPRPPESTDFIARMLFTSGRPVLIVPAFGNFPSLGERILIGWDGGREAARAVNDALPLLEKAQSATVLAINPQSGTNANERVPAADIALHLARHGVRAIANHTVAKEIGEADVLLNEAFDTSADLLVVGAYGHSRFREMLLGGITRRLLQEMTVPVFMSH
ncbi:universal stress protein [Acidibrevibacterium fodinaquatile]|uniref:universal stress protein n=1 Tax=Acidibrevibacterium fodinaquatile TaxID=1969806 RepID=UPI000E0DABF5|nr:universal stress protein [Acidibrevibacterium fodinaquatile]